MEELISLERLRVIKESTVRQLLEIEHFRQIGAINSTEAAAYRKIIIAVFQIQHSSICA